jgi:putative SOS response-associated peptidase YedK
VGSWFPSWAKDVKIGFKAFNARSETVLEKPMFRQAIRRRRCALPIPGYYEWETTEDGKQPWMMSAAGKDPLFMAGLFEFWKQPDQTLAGLDRRSSPWNRPDISVRCPPPDAGLPRHASSIDDWIDPGRSQQRRSPNLLSRDAWIEVDPASVTRHKVGKAVGNVRNDSPELVQPVA